MSIVDSTSMARTLDAVNEAVFYGSGFSPEQARETALWIVGREGRGRSYRGLPAPTPLDYERGARLFTGERVTSRAATGHILGEEACRALILLGAKDAPVREAIEESTGIVAGFEDPRYGRGFYCCGTCTPAFWRHLSVSPLKDAEERLAAGMKAVESLRDGTGKWRRFPFYYTLLALTELPWDVARSELAYAAPTCERLLKGPRTGDRYGTRRRDLLERALERCQELHPGKPLFDRASTLGL